MAARRMGDQDLPVRAVEERNGRVRVRVRVQPKASRNAVVFEPDGRIRVALTAPPIDGEANKALIVYIARLLGMPRSAVALVAGEKSREKTLEVNVPAAGDVIARLGRRSES